MAWLQWMKCWVVQLVWGVWVWSTSPMETYTPTRRLWRCFFPVSGALYTRFMYWLMPQAATNNKNNMREITRFLTLYVLAFYFFPYCSYAEKAENPALCVAAVRHFWNTCLPLTKTAEGRWQLQEPLETILNALIHTNTRHLKVWPPRLIQNLTLLNIDSVSIQRPWWSKHNSISENTTLRGAV